MVKEKIVNIPNTITLMRLILIPLFWFYLLNKKILPSLVVFCIISFGDKIDGYIARKIKQETFFGKIFDGIVDTILVYSSLIILSYLKKITILFLILLILPRVITFLIVFYKYLRVKKFRFTTSIYRKFATLLLLSIIILSLFKKNINLEVVIVMIANYLLLVFEGIKKLFIKS